MTSVYLGQLIELLTEQLLIKTIMLLHFMLEQVEFQVALAANRFPAVYDNYLAESYRNQISPPERLELLVHSLQVREHF